MRPETVAVLIDAFGQLGLLLPYQWAGPDIKGGWGDNIGPLLLREMYKMGRVSSIRDHSYSFRAAVRGFDVICVISYWVQVVWLLCVIKR